MILVDTSVWIDFFRGLDLSHVQQLEHMLQQGEDIALCGVILTEILQGIRDDSSFESTRNRLKSLVLLPMTESVFIQAAVMYRTLRAHGITVRKPIDCMIAATALEHGAKLLHNDRDFEMIGCHYPLRISYAQH